MSEVIDRIKGYINCEGVDEELLESIYILGYMDAKN